MPGAAAWWRRCRSATISRARGFKNLLFWSRGVDHALFRPRPGADLGLPRPIFLSVGRVAVEKNLEAFLKLDLPGSKVVVGDGPARAELSRAYPQAHFLGALPTEALAEAYAAADVFVFPSLTDTFGNVMLEALASGVPVAAFPVTGPKDIITDPRVGVLDADLRKAALAALELSREAAREFALGFSWEASAERLPRQYPRRARRERPRRRLSVALRRCGSAIAGATFESPPHDQAPDLRRHPCRPRRASPVRRCGRRSSSRRSSPSGFRRAST